MGYSRPVRYLHGSSLRLWKQDLTTDYRDKCGGIMRHGRATITRWFDSTNDRDPTDVKEGGSVAAEWAVAWPSSTAVYYEWDPSDGDHQIHWSLWRVWSVWLKWKPQFVPVEKRTGRAKARWEARDFTRRQIGVSFHGGTLFWVIWKDPTHWSRADGWRHSSFNIVNWALGKTTFSEDEISKTSTVVALPEGKYPVEVTLQVARWTRPRGFFGLGEHIRHQASIKVLDANGNDSFIPIPGKGESSWDCGEDGTWAMTCPASTVPEALANVVETVLRTRERHGGSVDWRPATPRALP